MSHVAKEEQFSQDEWHARQSLVLESSKYPSLQGHEGETNYLWASESQVKHSVAAGPEHVKQVTSQAAQF